MFIIRKDIREAFKEAIGDRIQKICDDLGVEIAYAYQELDHLSLIHIYLLRILHSVLLLSVAFSDHVLQKYYRQEP